MAAIKMLFTIAGVLALLLGLLWIGQGTGFIRWPSSSFMIGVSDWALRGAVLATGGALMILYGRRRT